MISLCQKATKACMAFCMGKVEQRHMTLTHTIRLQRSTLTDLAGVEQPCAPPVSMMWRAALQGQDDGTCIIAVPQYLQDREGEKPLGVYALYNAQNAVQYVGYSRNMVLAVKVGLTMQHDQCLHAIQCWNMSNHRSTQHEQIIFQLQSLSSSNALPCRTMSGLVDKRCMEVSC